MALSNPSPKTRKCIYRVVAALIAALVVYKVIDGEQSAAFLLIASAALGLADANVP